jgi:hypothetical protein
VRTRIALLAHVLFAVALIGEVLTLTLTSPHDADVLTVRLPDALLAVLTAVSGWILAWKRPGIPIGWLLLAVGLIQAPGGPLSALAQSLLHTDPAAAAWAYTFGFESRWTWIPALGLLVVILPLYFPSGRLPSPRWRWFSRFAIAALGVSTAIATTIGSDLDLGVRNPTSVVWPGGDGQAELVLALLLLTAATGSLVSVLTRYRHAGAVERAQLRWLFWAVAIIIGWLVLENIENGVFGGENSGGAAAAVATALDVVAGLTYSLIPIAILVGVLRYGLYTIDRIISRTAAYAVVTLAVVATYLAVVLVLSLLLPGLQTLGVALPTLAAAAVFLPLLRVVRRLIDRRFNRAQYDAEKVVERFGERVRNGADPHTAAADLVDAVQRTLQPTAVGVWTREGVTPAGTR